MLRYNLFQSSDSEEDELNRLRNNNACSSGKSSAGYSSVARYKPSSFLKATLLLECQKDDDLFIGFITKQTLKKLLENKIYPREADCFFYGVCAFYKATYEYCTKWLPLNNDLLKSCRFIDSAEDQNSVLMIYNLS